MKRFENDARRMDISAFFQEFVSPYTYPERDFFVCEYAWEEGTLLSSHGGLLAACGIEMPRELSGLIAAPADWPLSGEYRQKASEYFAALQEDIRNSVTAPSLFEMLVEAEGQRSWINVSGAVRLREDRRILELSFLSADNEKRELARLKDRSETDSLTQTLNRAGLINAMESLAASGRTYAFLMVDIDGFKHYNDTYGHKAGDELLTKVANRLAAGLKPEDLIARVGGDEFVICLCSAEENESIQRTVRHVHAAVQENADDLLSVSMGVAMSPKDGTTFEELYEKADVAMYCARSKGGNSYLFYESDMVMPGQSVETHAMEHGIQHLLVRYCHADGTFVYPPEMSKVIRADFDERPLWSVLEEDGAARPDTARRIRESLLQLCAVDGPPVHYSEYLLKTASGMWHWFRIGMISAGGDSQICITFTDVNNELYGTHHTPEYDEVTGLLSHSAFTRKVDRILKSDPDGSRNGDYAMVFFDVVRFKAINDKFGTPEGDRLLVYIANGISSLLGRDEAVCRLISDQYAVFLHRRDERLDDFVESYTHGIGSYNLGIEIVSNMGIYITTGEKLSADAMVDRAKLAQAPIKGSYTNKVNYYSEEMRNAMLGEQEITGMANNALAEQQFVAYYQPQYDHSNGELIGAEALVRWMHPERGLVSPGLFIPTFEKNGFITRLDIFVFEQVCRFQRRCMEKGVKPVPISVNLTRYDIYQPQFIEALEEIRLRYDVPVELLRIEITETAVVGDNQQATKVIAQLHDKGYVVEMDDFGSGYSSLNVLKDIDLDILKLDMRFLSNKKETSRSGTILRAMVSMAKGLELTVIAEGVERMQQADYLRSIGCNLVQGYLYKKPLPEVEFFQLLKRSTVGEPETPMRMLAVMDSDAFWNPDSLQTLIFNHYVGGAMTFEYKDGRIEVLRVNPKYIQELGGNLTEHQLLGLDPLTLLDQANRQLYTDMLTRAIESQQEEECETWRSYEGCTGQVCIRSTVKLIGLGKDHYMFYEAIRNITEEKNALNEVIKRENLFRAASEQVNIYYWEYDFATRDMIPCFRCQRDLAMPEVLKNYPDSAIEMGVFPQEIADDYRAMMRTLEEGAPSLDVEIPLTAERIMFRLRYTTVYDDNGKAIKAYGSAVPVDRGGENEADS